MLTDRCNIFCRLFTQCLYLAKRKSLDYRKSGPALFLPIQARAICVGLKFFDENIVEHAIFVSMALSVSAFAERLTVWTERRIFLPGDSNSNMLK